MKTGNIRLILTLLFVLSLSCGCVSSDAADGRAAKNQTGSSDIKRVGVVLGWESDYLLENDKSIQLYKYDEMADMILALRYNKVDAISLDGISTKVVEAMSTGMKKVEPEIGQVGYMALFNEDNIGLRDEYSSFMTDFIESDEYRDYKEWKDSFNGFDYQERSIESTGTGRKIKVAYMDTAYPRAFTDTNTNEPAGFDLYPLLLWANEMNYKVEFMPSSYTDLVQGLKNKKYDLAIGYLSDVYNSEYELFGLKPGTPQDYDKIYYMEKTGETMSVAEGLLD